MRDVILTLCLPLVLCLTGCAAYPKIDWPAAAPDEAAPALLPQSSLGVGPPSVDGGPALVSRAAELRGWAASVAH